MSRDRWLDGDEERTVPRRGPRSDDQDKNRFIGLLILLLGVYFVLERATGTDLRLFPFLATAFFGSLAWRGAGWAWIPTAIFGVGVFSQIGGAFAASDLMLPTVFVIGGGMLLLRDHIPPITRKVIFLVLGIMALGAIFGNDDDHDPNPDIDININHVREQARLRQQDTVPALNGRQLVIQGSDGDVELTESPTFTVTGSRTIRQTEREVFVTSSGNGDIAIAAPAGTEVRVVTRDGDVSAEGSWDSMTIVSREGDVDIETDALAPTLTVSTRDGSIDIAVTGDPDVKIATSSGDIDLEGYEGDDDPDQLYVHDGPDGGAVNLTTRSGDVDLSRRDRELR